MTEHEKLLLTRIEAALKKRAIAQRLLEEAEEEIRAASAVLKAIGGGDAGENA